MFCDLILCSIRLGIFQVEHKTNVSADRVSRREGRPRSLTDKQKQDRKSWSNRFRELLKRARKKGIEATSEKLQAKLNEHLATNPDWSGCSITKVTIDKWRADTVTVPLEEEATAIYQVLDENGVFESDDEKSRFLKLWPALSKGSTERQSLIYSTIRMINQLGHSLSLASPLQNIGEPALWYLAAVMATQYQVSKSFEPKPDMIIVLRTITKSWGPKDFNDSIDRVTSAAFLKAVDELSETCEVGIVLVAKKSEDVVAVNRVSSQFKECLDKKNKITNGGKTVRIHISDGGIDVELSDVPHRDVWLHFFDKPKRISGWAMEEIDPKTILLPDDFPKEDSRLTTIAIPLSEIDCACYETALCSEILRHEHGTWKWNSEGATAHGK